MSLSKYPPNITDLPVDVISLVFEHLPLSEVLRNQSLVCKVFYEAHRQYCRSSVKQLTLVGHYMISYITPWPSVERITRPQSDAERKLELFKYARLAGDSSSTSEVINSSTVHLKLVPGREEAAYEAIGVKFKSVTHLELHHLPLERHYDQIAAMINAWGDVKSSGSGSNQLADLKVFFSKEAYTVDRRTIMDVRQDSACFAYLLSEALTPAKAPALRRLTMLLSTESQLEPWLRHIHHNRYRGERLKYVQLSQLQAIDAVGFKACGLPGSAFFSRGFDTSNLRHLSISLNDLVSWTRSPVNTAAGIALLRGLTSLSFTNLSTNFSRTVAFRRLVAALERDDAAENQRPLQLKKLTLMKVTPSLSKVLRELVVPLTIDSTPLQQKNNHHLVQLRVNFANNYSGLISKKSVGSGGDLRALHSVSFQALTTLHLGKSNLLHRYSDLNVLALLFPNLVHLRLEGNYRSAILMRLEETDNNNNQSGNGLRHFRQNDGHVPSRDCQLCTRHIWEVFGQPKVPSGGHDFQHITSSTSDVCKASFVRRAEASWPTSLLTITLQIEDFYEHALKNGIDLKYRSLSETLVLRNAATGETVPEQERVWKVEKVPY